MEFSCPFRDHLQRPSLEVQAPVYTQKTILERFTIFLGSNNRPLERHFRPQSRLLSYPARVGGPSWSRPGRDLASKTLQGRIFIDLWLFLVDFGKILDKFRLDFRLFVVYFGCNFCLNSGIKSLIHFSQNCQTTNPRSKKENPQPANPQTRNLSNW